MATTLLSLAACSSSVTVGMEAVAGLTFDGAVDMHQVQAAFIGSGGGGTGTLFYQGRMYRVNVGGGSVCAGPLWLRLRYQKRVRSLAAT